MGYKTNQYREINDEEAQVFIHSQDAKEDYMVFLLWPRMLEVVTEVGNLYDNTPYKYRCQEVYAAKYKDGVPMDDGSKWAYLWYAATNKYRDLIQDAQDIDMANKGYTPFLIEDIKEIPTSGTALITSYPGTKPQKCKISTYHDTAFFIRPRAKKSGWSAYTLATADNRMYYKIID